MSERQISCGLFIESPAGVLLAHATQTPRWDLPKGRLELNELPVDAALRECLEETGLDFYSHRAALVDRGCHKYLPKKDLHLFTLKVPEALDLSGCFCSTKAIRRDGREVFETDAYAWVPHDQIVERVGKSLVAYLEGLQLIPVRPRPRSNSRP